MSDVVVPRNRVAEFINYTHDLEKELNIRIPSFGHAGDGNLHLYICRDELGQKKWEEMLDTAMDKLYAKSLEFDGLVWASTASDIPNENTSLTIMANMKWV